jgi:hypothetical protein
MKITFQKAILLLLLIIQNVSFLKAHELSFENFNILKYASLEKINTRARLSDTIRQSLNELNKAILIDRTNALKLDAMFLMSDIISISYEKRIKSSSSIELGVGVMGWGFNREEGNAKNGFFVSGGLRYYFKNSVSNYAKNSSQSFVSKTSHPLEGTYLKPELIYNNYNENILTIEKYQPKSSIYTYTINHSNYTYKISSFNLVINLGNQWIIKNKFLIDLYGGFGMGKGNKELLSITNSNFIYPNSYNYDGQLGINLNHGSRFLKTFDNGFSLIGQIGLKLGVLIGAN